MRHHAARLVVVAVVVAASTAATSVACNFAQDLGSDARGAGGDGSSPEASASDASADDALDGPDGGGRVDAGARGPGPFGALPSGYCCTGDDDCRFRACRGFGDAGRMCLDECSASVPALCTRPGLTFTCADTDGTGERCQPPAGFACIPADTFVPGAKTTGGCCTFAGDGTTGHECEANLCLALGERPWFCTRRCDAGVDCPASYQCVPVGDRSECVPIDTTGYACGP